MTQSLTITAETPASSPVTIMGQRVHGKPPATTVSVTFTAADGIIGHDLKAIAKLIEGSMSPDARITGINLTETQENPEPPTSGIASRRKTK